MIELDPAICGNCRSGESGNMPYARCGVYNNKWEFISKTFANGGMGQEMTRRKLMLGKEDSTTGWLTERYSESTIIGVLTLQASGMEYYAAGVFFPCDGVLHTLDELKEFDRLDFMGERYTVTGVVEHFDEENSFAFNECILKRGFVA